jgi:hypothetical protein
MCWLAAFRRIIGGLKRRVQMKRGIASRHQKRRKKILIREIRRARGERGEGRREGEGRGSRGEGAADVA